MPIYEYTCKSCNKKFDQLVRRMTGEHQATCPECGSHKAARSFSVFAVGAEAGPKSAGGDTPMCGRCGMEPGSCGME